MAHKGLSPDAVVKAAVELIEQQGRDAFSMRLLADQLGIKTASLYNHVENMETLLSEVCRYGMCLQKEAEMQAIEGWHGEEAVRFLAETYRSFAKEHRELYWLIMNMAAKDFNLKEEESIHYRRLFRAIVHGFVSQEEQGFFSHYPAEVDGSFHFAVQCYIDSLKQGEKRCS